MSARLNHGRQVSSAEPSARMSTTASYALRRLMIYLCNRVDENRVFAVVRPALVESAEGLVGSKGLSAKNLLVGAKVVAASGPPSPSRAPSPGLPLPGSPWVLQTQAAPTFPLSCREPSVQMVSRRLHSLANWKADALSPTMIWPGKRRAALHSCPSAVQFQQTAAAALSRAVRADFSRFRISSGL